MKTDLDLSFLRKRSMYLPITCKVVYLAASATLALFQLGPSLFVAVVFQDLLILNAVLLYFG